MLAQSQTHPEPSLGLTGAARAKSVISGLKRFHVPADYTVMGDASSQNIFLMCRAATRRPRARVVLRSDRAASYWIRKSSVRGEGSKVSYLLTEPYLLLY